jgi:hypothetical protein
MAGEVKIRGLLIVLVIILLTLLAVAYSLWEPPCRRPISYRIGEVDERFGLSREEFAEYVKAAADLWGRALSRPLFREDPQGVLEIRLVYDYRQEATDRLKKLNIHLDRSQGSYQALRERYEQMRMEWEGKKAALQVDLETHNRRVQDFNARAEAWKREGRGDRSALERLLAEKRELDAQQETLKNRQEEVRTLAETLSSLAVVVNEIASAHNLALVDYKETGRTLGKEFCEGLYEKDKGRRTITIYQFDDTDRLIRVLAHELGHALGLDHSDQEGAVMYRVIGSGGPVLAPDDIRLLKKLCGD